MEMVVVPLHRRPGFALACLTRLYYSAAKDKSLNFHIAIDANPDPEVQRVAHQFREHVGDHRVRVVQRSRTFRGNSYNVLTSYAEVVDSGADIIHLVEEDVLVGADYFEYHREAREVYPNAFSVCACRNQFWGDKNPPHEEDAIYVQACYQSIGVSFTPEKLRLITPHATHSFFANPASYIPRKFPHSPLGRQYLEQDGLIYRVVIDGGHLSVFPCAPRAYHAGFTGYNRGGVALPGTPEMQARRILSMTSEEMNAMASGKYQDYQVIGLDAARKQITRTLEWF